MENSKNSEVIAMLQKAVANTYVLYIKTLNFHWNIRDPAFIALHTMLEDQYNALAEAGDVIAERIRILGNFPIASMKEFLEHTTIKEALTHSIASPEMLQLLVDDNNQCAKELKECIKAADAIADYGTSDMATDYCRYHEKQAWMLRSHLV